MAGSDTSAAAEVEASNLPVDMELLHEALDMLRPAIEADGGDLEFLGVSEEGVVTVRLTGACETCPLSVVTLTAGIEALLLKRVPGVTGVVTPPPERSTEARKHGTEAPD